MVKVVSSIIGFFYDLKQPKPIVQTLKEGLIGVSYMYSTNYNLLFRQSVCYFIVEHTSLIFYFSFLSHVPLRTSISEFHYVLSFDCGL